MFGLDGPGGSSRGRHPARGRKGGREEEEEREREGKRDGERVSIKEEWGGREGGREAGKEGGREGGREGERKEKMAIRVERGREGRQKNSHLVFGSAHDPGLCEGLHGAAMPTEVHHSCILPQTHLRY